MGRPPGRAPQTSSCTSSSTTPGRSRTRRSPSTRRTSSWPTTRRWSRTPTRSERHYWMIVLHNHLMETSRLPVPPDRLNNGTAHVEPDGSVRVVSPTPTPACPTGSPPPATAVAPSASDGWARTSRTSCPRPGRAPGRRHGLLVLRCSGSCLVVAATTPSRRGPPRPTTAPDTRLTVPTWRSGAVACRTDSRGRCRDLGGPRRRDGAVDARPPGRGRRRPTATIDASSWKGLLDLPAPAETVATQATSCVEREEAGSASGPGVLRAGPTRREATSSARPARTLTATSWAGPSPCPRCRHRPREALQRRGAGPAHRAGCADRHPGGRRERLQQRQRHRRPGDRPRVEETATTVTVTVLLSPGRTSTPPARQPTLRRQEHARRALRDRQLLDGVFFPALPAGADVISREVASSAARVRRSTASAWR